MKHHQIQYIEFSSNNFYVIKKFYTGAFGWEFTDYGSEYISFSCDCIEGGFGKGKTVKGSVLIILYSEKLEESKKRVEENGGIIVRDIFSFPGGRRFHFTDPDENELAVWSDK